MILLALASGSAPAASDALNPPGAGTFTTISFVLIAVLAVLALLIIVVGIRRAQARRQAEERVQEEAIEAGVATDSPAEATPVERPDAPPPAVALDRSVSPSAPVQPVNNDFISPRPVAPDPLHSERVAAAAPMEASPAVEAESAPVAASAAAMPADGSVRQLKGLGPKVAARLEELGITTVGQIAALDADEAQALDDRLGPFAGRMHRDRWVEQARFLAAGDRAGFEAVFGKLRDN